MTYENIKEIYQDIIDLWGEDLGGQIVAACGGNWVAMIYYGLKSIAPSVTALIPDKIQQPMKEFITLNNIVYLLGVHEVDTPPD